MFAELPPATVEEQVEDLSIWDMEPSQLSEFALDLFMQHDADRSGGLDRREFKAVLTSTALGFTSKEVREIMARRRACARPFLSLSLFFFLSLSLPSFRICLMSFVYTRARGAPNGRRSPTRTTTASWTTRSSCR